MAISNNLPQYCAVIRTLGKAGEKYQRLLDDLCNQSHRPKRILVYLAKGYDKPTESVGVEEIIYVKKGMVAQRALKYDEVDTEWILFLDDDISIEPDGVANLFRDTLSLNADVCAIDGFPHHKLSAKTKFTMALLASATPRLGSPTKGYTVNITGSDEYNPNPKYRTAWSTTNSGNAFLCRKQDFLKIHFEEDLWLDASPYAIPEDKVMFYKMHLKGLKILTHYSSGFKHLDAGTAITGGRRLKMVYSSARNNRIFYKIYIWPNLSKLQKCKAAICLFYQRIVTALYHFIKEGFDNSLRNERNRGIADANKFLTNISK